MSDDERLGRLAYDAYRKAYGTVTTELLPSFDSLVPRNQEAWRAAAKAVVDAVINLVDS